MSNITLFKNNEKSPVFKDFSNSIIREKKNIQDLFQIPSYQSNVSEAANPLFTESRSWEFFSNELEFE